VIKLHSPCPQDIADMSQNRYKDSKYLRQKQKIAEINDLLFLKKLQIA
jgi:hypothetical protein